jgi:ribonuclease HI
MDHLENKSNFKCGISKWPSSTRGELIAIFTALLTIPEHGHVDIYTDSLAAIQNIEFFLNKKYSVRDVFKSNNYSILGKIIDLIKGKSLLFSIYKVKGHLDDAFNDMADILAKEALSEVGLLKSRVISIDNLDRHQNSNNIVKVSISWNDNYIDTNLRKFVRLIEEDKVCANWSLNNSIVDLTEDMNIEDWSILWCTLETLEKFYFTKKHQM